MPDQEPTLKNDHIRIVSEKYVAWKDMALMVLGFELSMKYKTY